MQIKVAKRMVEVEEKTYIAFDGTEFATEEECRKHEENIEEQKIKSEAESLEIKELEDTYPLDVDANYISDNHCYKWYKVNNVEEYTMVARAYRSDDFYTLNTYPEIICVEYEDYWGKDAWVHLLSDMKIATEYFWKRHGFDVEFKER